MGPHGKPRLAAPACDLEFNLSHAGAFALVAVTQGRPVGVDLEWARAELATDAIAEVCFSRDEQRRLNALAAQDRLPAFFRLWTRKEAFIKATGLGMSADLKAFDVSLGDSPALLATRPDPGEAARWELGSFLVPDGYTGAWAVAK